MWKTLHAHGIKTLPYCAYPRQRSLRYAGLSLHRTTPAQCGTPRCELIAQSRYDSMSKHKLVQHLFLAILMDCSRRAATLAFYAADRCWNLLRANGAAFLNALWAFTTERV